MKHDKTTHMPNDNELVCFIETGLTIVGERRDGILEIRFKKDHYEVDVKDQLEIQKAIAELTNDGKKRCHIIVIPGLFGGVTKEARNMETFNNPVFKGPYSINIVVRNLSQRILGKFYYSFKKDKPAFPFQLFASEELALKWIKEQK